ncbi:unnamed protein product [Thlaspi arvense]|uniref:SAM-dependent MTase RsmB/NOP-type domain-containing protein n=1 Tax=Thlaspi arvense TaxID=13288 RepID=A0AAU9TE95_THLAR|nr:unnamed protein product [Thlaspi arvense]
MEMVWDIEQTRINRSLCEALHQVHVILLDPSCSGSGTTAIRLDHLLPSHGTVALLLPSYLLKLQ